MGSVMIYSIGDRVQVHDRDWYDLKSNSDGNIYFPNDMYVFGDTMVRYLGQKATIEYVDEEHRTYGLKFDSERVVSDYTWRSWMFKAIDDRVGEFKIQEQKRYRLWWLNEEIDKLLQKEEIDDDTLQHLLYLCDEKELVTKEIKRMSDFVAVWRTKHKKI